MLKNPLVSMLNLALPLSESLDLVSPKIVNHNRRVAFIAYSIGSEMGMPHRQRRDLLMAGLFHDIGAFSLKERLEFLAFELANPHLHGQIGYKLLKDFKPFETIADIVRFHHVYWCNGEGRFFKGIEVPFASHIIHLADRIAVLVPEQRAVLGQSRRIIREIRNHSGSMFAPELVEVVEGLAAKEHFWLDTASAVPTEPLRAIIDMDSVELDIEVLQGFTKLFSEVIDFRSPFTAAHSSGVAACAEVLAKLAGFSVKERQLISVAGHLHDLGKLVVPSEILEKRGSLSVAEWDVMRTHSYFGFRTLQKIPSLETVNMWASLHHERLDGSGYPFKLKEDDLPLGARIMAVADIFAALTEDRPYRPGMSPEKATEIVAGMAKDGAIDGNIVDLLMANKQQINNCRLEKSAKAFEDYRRLFEYQL